MLLYVLAFLVLLDCLVCFLRKINSWSESLPQARPSLASYAPSDSPYQGIHPQAYPQLSPPRPASSYYPATPQYSAYPTPSQHSPYHPHHQPSTGPPTQTTPLIPNDVSVARPVRYTSEQIPRPATPIQTTLLIPNDVSVARPARYTSEQIPHPATTQAPEVTVAPLVSDLHEDHESLRLKARREGDRMVECFRQSKEAFASNQKKLAKELSIIGQACKENMVRLDKEASAKIFEENNQRCNPNTVDLHGLYVTEAEFYFKRTLEQVRDRGETSLRVIVGKGNHSDGNNPKIKPAIQVLGKSLGLTIKVDPVNDGCLLVNC